MYKRGRFVRLAAAASLILTASLTLSAAPTPATAALRADRLHLRQRDGEALALLNAAEDAASDPLDRAALYWRISRSRFVLAEERLFDGAEKGRVLEEFRRGADYARRADELYRGSFDASVAERSRALFWLAANRGRAVRLEGALASLRAAGELRELLEESIRLDPAYSEPYYVLAQLYSRLPGGLLSWGDDDRAVNLGRKAVALLENSLEVDEPAVLRTDYYLELARHLYRRDWGAERRAAVRRGRIGEPAPAGDPLEQSYRFSAAVAVPDGSDREEAAVLLLSALGVLEELPGDSKRRAMDLEKARAMAAEWGIP